MDQPADATDSHQLLPPSTEWQSWTPMASLAPAFAREATGLRVIGNGNPHCFGAWCRTVPVRPGTAYRLSVTLEAAGVPDPGLHLTPHIVWRRGDLTEDHCAQDAIRAFQRHGARLEGEDVFVAPANCNAAQVRLLLRYAPAASVCFRSVALEPVPAPAPRPLRIGTMRARPESGATPAQHRTFYAERVTELAALGADLVVVPEFANVAGAPLEPGPALLQLAEPLDGPFCHELAGLARRHQLHVCAGVLERDGDLVYNTAVLLDSDGTLRGRQRKVHPYWPEEPLGVVPGDTFDVFATRFGTVGIMICYDSWWPESARLLALKGAELILFPNAGYEERVLPARAIDNNVYVVAASLGSPAAIVTPRGETLTASAAPGVVCAQIDLADRPRCHPNAGGNLNGGPGGGRWARNARSHRVYAEILEQVRGTADAAAPGLGRATS